MSRSDDEAGAVAPLPLAVVFAVTAIGYLVLPGVMLSVVGVASNANADFLIRTEGVALLAAAIFLWAARSGPPGLIRIVLAGLGVYYVLRSLVDLAAFAQGIVGTASLVIQGEAEPCPGHTRGAR